MSRLAITTAILTASSCSPSEVVTHIPPDHARLKAIVTVYAYACRDLGRPPENFEELLPVLQQAKIENPREYFMSTRDGQPYIIIWGLDLVGRYLDSKVPIAYELVGEDGVRLVVTSNLEVEEVSTENFAQLKWPTGHEPELAE